MNGTAGMSAATAALVYDLADNLTQFRYHAESNWVYGNPDEPVPDHLDVRVGQVVLIADDLTGKGLNAALTEALKRSVDSAWKRFNAAWQGPQHRKVVEALRNADSEFRVDHERNMIRNKSPFTTPAWAELKRAAADLQAALPPTLHACYQLSLLLASELYLTDEAHRLFEKLQISQLRFLTVNLNRQVKELLTALAREYPKLTDLDYDLAGETERSAMVKIRKLHEIIPPRLRAAQSGAHGQDGETPEVEVGLRKATADERTSAKLTFLPGAFLYRGNEHRLSGKPLQVLQAMDEARGKTITLSDLQDTVWKGTSSGEEAIRSAVKAARKALREAMTAAGVEGRKDPIPNIDRGSGRTAWRLDLQ